MNILLKFLIVAALVLTSCKNNSSEQTADAAAAVQQEEDSLPADFMNFYMRFHTDSLYQMAHITFPVEGYLPNVAVDSVAPQAHQWQREEWRMHRPINNDSGDFRQEYETLNNMVVEYIINDDEKMAMERRFTKLGKDWYLIYYMGMNRVSYE